MHTFFPFKTVSTNVLSLSIISSCLALPLDLPRTKLPACCRAQGQLCAMLSYVIRHHGQFILLFLSLPFRDVSDTQSDKARCGTPPPAQTGKSAAFQKRDFFTIQKPQKKNSKSDQDYILSEVGSQFDVIGMYLGRDARMSMAIHGASNQLMLIHMLQTTKPETKMSI